MIYKSSGIIGVQPWSFTLRELLIMAEAKRRESWDHTANLMLIIAGLFNDKVKIEDFHPFYEEKVAVFRDDQANEDAFKILKGLCKQ